MNTVIKLNTIIWPLSTHSLFIFFSYFLEKKMTETLLVLSTKYVVSPSSLLSQTHRYILPPSVPPLSLSLLPFFPLPPPTSFFFCIFTSLFYQNEFMIETSLRQSWQLALCTCLYIVASVNLGKGDPFWDGVGTSKIKWRFSFDSNTCRMMRYLTISFPDDLPHSEL